MAGPREVPRPERFRAGSRRRPGRYLLVLTLLLTSYLVPAFLHGRPAAVPSVLLSGLALLVVLAPGSRRRTSDAIRAVVAAGSLLAALAAVRGPSRFWDAAVNCWLAAIMLLAVVVVLRRILRQRVVTPEAVYAALSAYLLMGFMFAALFGAVAALDPDPFFRGAEPEDAGTLLYFSVVTLTTTGYGDLTAAQPPGRSLAALEALAGQFFMATLVARLVSLLGRSR
jgi:hypothetical protein